MLSRCSGEFMYAWNSLSADDVGPSPTFSPYAVQFGLPWVSSWWPRSGLCDNACCWSRWFVQLAATLDVPLATVSALSPWSARAWLISDTKRLPKAAGDDSAAAEVPSSAATPSTMARAAPATTRTLGRTRIDSPRLVDYDLITQLGQSSNGLSQEIFLRVHRKTSRVGQ